MICCCPMGKSIKHNFWECPARIVTNIKDDNQWPWIGLAWLGLSKIMKQKNSRTKYKKWATMYYMMLQKSGKQTPIGVHIHITDIALKSISKAIWTVYLEWIWWKNESYGRKHRCVVVFFQCVVLFSPSLYLSHVRTPQLHAMHWTWMA